MSWRATGYGTILPKRCEIPENILSELNSMDEFELQTRGYANDGLWYILYDRNFRSDCVEQYLNKISPYLESGKIEMEGEDSTYWKYVFHDGTWDEYAGKIVYEDELLPANKSNESRLEFLHDIIDVFENFLGDKGIVIDNPEKAQAIVCAANIYGTDYGDLKSELECVLKGWGALS